MVHESVGPVLGLMSQICVCRKRPPGKLKQQLGGALDWQLIGPLAGQWSMAAIAAEEPSNATATSEKVIIVASPLQWRRPKFAAYAGNKEE